jgi:hypothetical protein
MGSSTGIGVKNLLVADDKMRFWIEIISSEEADQGSSPDRVKMS